MLSLGSWASLREVRAGSTTDPAARRYGHDASLATERDPRGTAGDVKSARSSVTRTSLIAIEASDIFDSSPFERTDGDPEGGGHPSPAGGDG